jgi:SPP1 gp7 family putative phage head morphogenesis protein
MSQPLLTKKRQNWIDQRENPPIMRGTPLLYPDITAQKYSAKIQSLLVAMQRETEREVLDLFKSSDSPIIATTDASISSQARFLLARLARKYNRIFKRDFPSIVLTMLKGVDTASKSNTHQSLKELSGGLMVKTDFLTGEMNEQFKAFTAANVSLFKTITSNHFAKVEAKVMDSITTGNGLKDLKPFFDTFGNTEKNYAHNRAMDQTRKAYASINQSRLERLGVKRVQWVHSHGANDPRKLHQELDGKIFDIDSPPFSGTMYNEPVYAFGGVLPNCRCTVRPVLEFKQ